MDGRPAAQASLISRREFRRDRRSGHPRGWPLLVLAGLVGFGLWSAAPDLDAAFLWPTAGADWIGAPDPPGAASIRSPRGEPPVFEFRRRFELGVGVDSAVVEFRALRAYTLELNGQRLAESEASGDWREKARVEIGGALRPGENWLSVRVWNPRGPALLSLRVVAGGADLSTRGGNGWQVGRPGAAGREAVVADDTRRAPSAYAVPPLDRIVRSHADHLLLVLTACCLGAMALRSARGRSLHAPLSRGLWPGIALFWAALYIGVAIRLPAFMGFDGPDHLAYIRRLLEGGGFPLATDGPMMYHPPLFYAVSAALLVPFGGASALDWSGATAALRLVPLASGLVQLAVAFQLARLLFPKDRAVASLAALVASLLPMNLYTAAYMTNEGLHAALAALAILSTARLLRRPGLPWPGLLVVGLLLGLAGLTKATSLILVPLVLGFLAVKGVRVDRRAVGPVLLRVGAVAATSALLLGWVFARNWTELGQPVVGNWDVPGSDFTWWQYPGFHTPSYFLSFGAVLTRPFLAGYESFFDGIYSTFWGDGMIGGIGLWRNRHLLWNYDAMAIAYLFALPVTVLWVGGIVSLAARCLRGTDPRLRFTLAFLSTTLAVAGLTVFALTVVHPAFGMTKAFYALFAAAPLCVAGAHALLGVHRFLERRWQPAAILYDGWLAALAVTIGIAFLG